MVKTDSHIRIKKNGLDPVQPCPTVANREGLEQDPLSRLAPPDNKSWATAECHRARNKCPHALAYFNGNSLIFMRKISLVYV